MYPSPFAVYFVASSFLTGGRPLTEVVAAAIAGGATAIQLREKDGSDRAFYQLGLAVRDVCRHLGALLLINDRLDLALALEADGVHLGQEDLPAHVARQLLGRQRWVGVSVESEDEAAAALAAGATYLATGPVFATSTKPDAGAPYGPAIVRRIADMVARHGAAALTGPEAAAASGSAGRVPLVAIGGITAANGAEVIAAGADGLAVSSALGLATDPAAAARTLSLLWASKA